MTLQYIPKIALVGRPNVGKSALFNAIINRPFAIVDEEEGITRDRLYAKSELFSRQFEIIDTGGLLGKNDQFHKEITQQAEIAIEEADGIIFVVDGTFHEPHALDIDVARILRRTKKPLCLAVNKVDSFEQQESMLQRFTTLGIQPMISVSASHRMHIAELMEAILKQIPVTDLDTSHAVDPDLCHVAIIGRPNVGKSLLLNTLLGEERSIVSPIAGTTRDMIDSTIDHKGSKICFIDTAGIRRKHKEKVTVEKFASIRTERAIERADICLLVIDCQDGITHEEKKIASMIEEAECGCIVLINKWDLAKNCRMEHAITQIEKEVPFLQHCPKIIISAKTGRNVDSIFDAITSVQKSMKQRITTGQLNKALMSWMQSYHPPMIGTKRLRIYYMAQIDIQPPKFVLFVNSASLINDGYKRYLINQLRKTFSFQGVPFLLKMRGREDGLQNNTKKEKRETALTENRMPLALRPVDRDLRSVASKIHEEEQDEFAWEENDDTL